MLCGDVYSRTHGHLERTAALLLWTDIERMITVAQLERLLQLIAWCGRSVRSLRLDQQPRVLWAKDAIARAVRAGAGDTAEVRREAHRQAMEQMPWASVRVLQAIRRCCPRLEEPAPRSAAERGMPCRAWHAQREVGQSTSATSHVMWESVTLT